jgi:hypothetical protein
MGVRPKDYPVAGPAEGEEMTVEFSKRSIIIFIIVMIAATVLTVEGTYYALKTFVFDDANDPIVKGGGLTPDQKELGR